MWLVYQVMLGLMYEWDYFIKSPFILLPPSFCEHSLEASALVLLLGGNHQ